MRRSILAAVLVITGSLSLATYAMTGTNGLAQQGISSCATAPFPNFESGQTRPLLLSPSGNRLYVLNTPDHRLEIYSTQLPSQSVLGKTLTSLRHQGGIFTGLEPVSMCLDPGDPNRMFVANTVSDTVSVLNLHSRAVEATIQAGDEPQDVVVTGGKLFIATARSAAGASLVDPGSSVENAVVVAQASAPYDVLTRISIPAVKPRALVAIGDTVYVIPQNSGNRTTVISEAQADQINLSQMDLEDFEVPFTMNPALMAPQFGGAPFINPFSGLPGWAVPSTGRIVMDDDPDYFGMIPALPDNDVLAIDVATHALQPGATTGVGTTLLGMERNPVTGDLWVVGTEALNITRFEPAVKGQAFENRVAIVTPGGAVSHVVNLGKRAQPASIAFYSGEHGDFAYVGSLGTANITVLDASTAGLHSTIQTGELPTGLAVDPARALLYVFTRGDKMLRVYDIARGHVQRGSAQPLAYDPEPVAISTGRTHLYDARTSTGAGNGNMSCASCHVFGHVDASAWDLGNPQGGLGYFFPDLLQGVLGFGNQTVARDRSIMTNPMKGPTTTQSLRGLQVPLHWRGDRRFFHIFRGAFEGLLGGTGITPEAMQEFANFVESLTYAPNPYQPKDRVYSGDEATGRDLFGLNSSVPGKPYNQFALPGVTCVDCHKADFEGETDFTGSQETVNFDGEPQLFNTAQLRAGYEKEYRNLTGFGVLHDGSVDSIEGFLNVVFNNITAFQSLTVQERSQVADFVLAWDTGLAPLVGAQRTVEKQNVLQMGAWLDLAQAQAEEPISDLDLVGKGRIGFPNQNPMPVGVVYRKNEGDGSYEYMTSYGQVFSSEDLRRAIAGDMLRLTFTCVPAGMGTRLGVDRDEDGSLDHLEPRLGTNPANPDSDGDGYSDGAEPLLGGQPQTFNAFLADAVDPTLSQVGIRSIFANTATAHFVADEPVRAIVEIGSSAGSYGLASFVDRDLRKVHDLVLSGLPAGLQLSYRIRAVDRNGNVGLSEGLFRTAAPMYHIQDVSVRANDSPPFTVIGRVAVVDQDGAPVVGIPVRAIWTGLIGAADFFPTVTTNAAGVAVFQLGPYFPIVPNTVTLSPAYVGQVTSTAAPFFVGRGGQEATFFYNQSANRENFDSLFLSF